MGRGRGGLRPTRREVTTRPALDQAAQHGVSQVCGSQIASADTSRIVVGAGVYLG